MPLADTIRTPFIYLFSLNHIGHIVKLFDVPLGILLLFCIQVVSVNEIKTK